MSETHRETTARIDALTRETSARLDTLFIESGKRMDHSDVQFRWLVGLIAASLLGIAGLLIKMP
ncbi:hypothetical protein GM676_27915 [Duganella radicis]|uniref:Uncharacterized protein n=1 Tax=Duganella radicis TaxID=551988 RepID=A0A6L6PQS2_9BURK|nr:hypothetical protein [Duganella radicis]